MLRRSAGPVRASGSTAAVASGCATPWSVSSTSTSRAWSCPPSPGCSSTSTRRPPGTRTTDALELLASWAASQEDLPTAADPMTAHWAGASEPSYRPRVVGRPRPLDAFPDRPCRGELLSGRRAWDHGVATPLLGCDVDQGLVEHPLVPERVIEGRLPLAVLPVVRRVDQDRPSRHPPLHRTRDIPDLEHHLVRTSPLRRSPAWANLGHHQLGRRPVRQAELRAMPLADANVLDESEHLDVPRHGCSDIGHGEDGGHPRVRCRPVPEHTVTLGRRAHRTALRRRASWCGFRAEATLLPRSPRPRR